MGNIFEQLNPTTEVHTPPQEPGRKSGELNTARRLAESTTILSALNGESTQEEKPASSPSEERDISSVLDKGVQTSSYPPSEYSGHDSNLLRARLNEEEPSEPAEETLAETNETETDNFREAWAKLRENVAPLFSATDRLATGVIQAGHIPQDNVSTMFTDRNGAQGNARLDELKAALAAQDNSAEDALGAVNTFLADSQVEGLNQINLDAVSDEERARTQALKQTTQIVQTTLRGAISNLKEGDMNNAAELYRLLRTELQGNIPSNGHIPTLDLVRVGDILKDLTDNVAHQKDQLKKLTGLMDELEKSLPAAD